jgi:hypothetical protein
MENRKLDDVYPHHELSFLTDTAKEWGWMNEDGLVFVQRMLNSNNIRSNEGLNKRLNLTEHKVRDTLSKKISPKLRTAGYTGQKWEQMQQWLKEEVFPQWVKPRLWGEMWKSAEPSDRIEIEVLSGGLLTAGSILRREDRIAIPEIPKIPLGANVEYHIPSAADRHLILLEKDGNGGICCLAPSRGFPRFEIAEPIAREELLAVVSSQEPKLSWLESARLDLVELDAMDLQELMVWVQGNEDCHLLRREFEIVA